MTMTSYMSGSKTVTMTITKTMNKNMTIIMTPQRTQKLPKIHRKIRDPHKKEFLRIPKIDVRAVLSYQVGCFQNCLNQASQVKCQWELVREDLVGI